MFALSIKISIHALREEGDWCTKDSKGGIKIFLSTPSARKATSRRAFRIEEHDISIHALREEGDKPPAQRLQPLLDFYPRPPRGGRRYTSASHWRDIDISIHALREEGDGSPTRPTTTSSNFYPRPPRGGRLRLNGKTQILPLFLSTPSARRATCTRGIMLDAPSIFLSTPSARRATVDIKTHADRDDISIHALREEGDGLCHKFRPCDRNFYPRPPRGGRQSIPGNGLPYQNFYPRPPRGGRPESSTASACI